MSAYDINEISDAIAALLNDPGIGVSPPLGYPFRAHAVVPDAPIVPGTFYLEVASVDPRSRQGMASTDLALLGKLYAAPLSIGYGKAQRILNGYLGNGPRDIWGILMLGETNTITGGVRAVLARAWEGTRPMSADGVDFIGSVMRIDLLTT